MAGISLAIVGATGVVGQKFLQVLAERNVIIDRLVLFASARSAGSMISFRDKQYSVIELTEENVLANPVDYALFSAGASIALAYGPIFARQKTIVIDNSSAFRNDPSIPLVVPEVNPEDAFKHHYIIANPNCSTIQAVVVIKPLHDLYTLKRVVISTYQAVSGAGSKGIHDLVENLPTGKTTKFPYQISGNVIPHIDVFLENGNTKEEEKIILEMRKILHLPTLRVSSTAVRVPVMNCHSESINLEFENPCDLPTIYTALSAQKGVIVYDEPSKNIYPMPIVVDELDDVYVGRIRKDASIDSGINCFVVGDNLRKGAATNAVQILQLLLSQVK